MNNQLHPLVLRRVGMIHGFLTAAKQLLHPIHVAIDGYRDLGTDDAGRPLPPSHVLTSLVEMGRLKMADVVSAACVAGVNLGYAYEHAFKLLNFMYTGKNAGGLRKGERHKLAKLYEQLPKNLQRDISSIYKSTRTHDIELEEIFGFEAPPNHDPPESNSASLLDKLKYWDRNNIFQGGRYTYVDATTRKRSVIRVYFPVFSVHFLEGILEEVVLPALGLEYVSPPSENRT